MEHVNVLKTKLTPKTPRDRFARVTARAAAVDDQRAISVPLFNQVGETRVPGLFIERHRAGHVACGEIGRGTRVDPQRVRIFRPNLREIQSGRRGRGRLGLNRAPIRTTWVQPTGEERGNDRDDQQNQRRP